MVIAGIIRPPPEIRAVADRTALYVAKNGRAFETRILNSSKGQTPKFAFLHDTSPFHAYYEDRIQFYENGGKDEKDDETKKDESNEQKSKEELKITAAQQQQQQQENDDIKQQQKTKKVISVIDPIAKALLKERTKIANIRAEQEEAAKQQNDDEQKEESSMKKQPPSIPLPPALHFVQIIAPASISLVQLEIIQTVAQFTALGKHVNFLEHLTRNEWNNPNFAFCQPRHGHFAYFSALVDAYSRILYNNWNPNNNSNNTKTMEKLANNVDACLEMAAYRAEYERDKAIQSKRNSGMDDENGPAKIDWHDFVVVETIDFPPDEIVTMLPPPPSVTTTTAATIPTTASMPQEEETTTIDDEDGETIRVVPSYTPRVVAANAATAATTVIDPITGKSVPVNEMPEHMRIQLLDPKWAEERKKFQDKQKESNLVSGDIVASNLERFASARGIDTKEQDILSQQAESKHRLQEANRIIQQHAQTPNITTVGPALPGQRKEPPPGVASVEQQPTSKKPKITYAPSVVIPPPPVQEQTPGAPAAPIVPTLPPPPIPTDPFSTVGTGTAVVPTTMASESQQELLSENEFAATLSKPDVTLQVRIPNDPSQMAWNFYGQIVSISVNVMSKIKAVKSEISTKHLNQLPPNKIQLKNVTTGMFLKDAMTLAALNIGPSATLELVPRMRGGKKK